MNIGGLTACKGGLVPPMQRLSFDSADSDSDGSLSLNEFKAVGKDLPTGKNVPGDDDVRNVFSAIDTDQNGAISKAEAKAAYDKVTEAMQGNLLKLQEQLEQPPAPPPPSPEGLMVKADSNADGTLSLDEFKGAAAKHHHHHDDDGDANARLANRFKSMDADNSGSVSADELKVYAEQNPRVPSPQQAPDIDMTALYAQAAGAYANQNGSGDMLAQFLNVLKGVQA